MQEASASQQTGPGEGEGWGWSGGRVMIGVQCTKEAKMSLYVSGSACFRGGLGDWGWCDCLLKPSVLPVQWLKKPGFLWYFLWIFMVFSWAAGKKNYKNKNPSGLLGEGVREAVHTLSCHAEAMCLSWFIFREELCCHCRKWLVGRVGDRTSSGNIKLFLCCGRWVATIRSVCTADCIKLQIECNIFRSS